MLKHGSDNTLFLGYNLFRYFTYKNGGVDMDPILVNAYIKAQERRPPEGSSDEYLVRGFMEVLSNPNYFSFEEAHEILAYIMNQKTTIVDKKLIESLEMFAGPLFGGSVETKEVHMAEIEARANAEKGVLS